MTPDPLARAQASLAIARDGALETVLRLTARLAEQQAELARLRAREQTISAAYNRQNDTIRRMKSERQAMQQRILELEQAGE